MGLSATDLAYLAGLLDGEGCFTVGTSGSPLISVEMTHLATIEWIADCFGTGVTTVRKRQPHHTQSFRTQAWGENAQLLAADLLPFLRIKHANAEVFQRWRRAPRGRGRQIPPEILALRAEIKAEIRRLNRRGGAHD